MSSIQKHSIKAYKQLLKENRKLAKETWGLRMNPMALQSLRALTLGHKLSISLGDLVVLENGWYVTHTGLIRVARRSRCAGIEVGPVSAFSNPEERRWVFRATVYISRNCKGFVGYGDADPSNVSSLMRGTEMRIAETRAVNRALRKAYGIGVCSVEELGTVASPSQPLPPKKTPPQAVDGHSNTNGPRVRDRLCQLIRQHNLDPNLVKSYAIDYCGTEALRDATREQLENFVVELGEWAAKDRNALVCQLNSYMENKAGAA